LPRVTFSSRRESGRTKTRRRRAPP
jgi:hypothetical protein